MTAALVPQIASSLMQLTSLTLSGVGYWVNTWGPQLLVLTGLQHLQKLDLGYTPTPSVALATLQPLPITGIRIQIVAEGGVDAVEAWLQVAASTLEALELDYVLFRQQGVIRGRGSDVARLLGLLSPAAVPQLRQLKLERLQ